MLKRLRLNHPVWYCILIVVLANVVMSVGQVVGELMPETLRSTTLIVMCLGNVAAAALFMVVLQRTGRFSLVSRQGIGFGRGMLYGLLAIALCVVKFLLDPLFTVGPLNPPLTIAIFVIWMLAIGITEESECRAIMAETLLEHFGTKREGILKAAFISAAIFGAMHLVGLTSPNVNALGVVMQSVSAVFAGLMFAGIYFRTGNIWVPVIVHALWDFFSFLPMKSALFANATGVVTDTVSNVSWPLEITAAAVVLAYALYLLYSKGLEEAVKKNFDDLVGQAAEEKAELAKK